MRRRVAALLALACATPALAGAPADADTKAWWQLIGQLSSDAMQGRDTGSPGHARGRYGGDAVQTGRAETDGR